ncbi:MAG: bifunctional aspartate kinase/homoserine dehydrogenase I [Flavobacteriales bacterium]|nr:bifunctional aspartate kinase/homoserine dehydrogenase I [Flavobacteriales bacterium]
MKVLKFGGKSLSAGAGNPLQGALDIMSSEARKGKILVVCSARGKSTDMLEDMLEKAARGEDYMPSYMYFCERQQAPDVEMDMSSEFAEMRQMLEGVALLGEYSLKIKDRFMSFGEILSCKMVAHLLSKRGFKTRFVDSRRLIKTTDEWGSASVIMDVSRKNVEEFFADAQEDVIEVVTGFIGTTINNQTTTLGRNGSNYSATLMAAFLGAEEVQNWTNVDGVYTANPTLVEDAQIIPLLSYREANELANFGTNVLHAKTILPLIEKKIPIRILNSFNPSCCGTTIAECGSGGGLKAISVISDVALVSIEGRGMLGKVGIDGRIFSALSSHGVSVRIVSQASSERGIGFIVDAENASLSKEVLEVEFEREIHAQDIQEIAVNNTVSVISIIGRHIDFLDKAYAALRSNSIEPYLINNTINGEHLSFVVNSSQLKKAVNVIHNHIFGVYKKINVLVAGCGTVGGTLIDQILSTQQTIVERRGLRLNVFGVANSRGVLLDAHGVGTSWRERIKTETVPYTVESLLSYIENYNLENVIVVDNTASRDFVENYSAFVEAGCNLVASNKIANTLSYDSYSALREVLRRKGKKFLYEANVGAGLPLVDTIRQLCDTGDEIRRVRGVFSGTLSYIFNIFSSSDVMFSQVLREAMQKGYTEPDPREDLCGNDVARKLLILAREIGMKKEFEDIEIENLIPEALRGGSVDEFLAGEALMNDMYGGVKSTLADDEVLRYVGELNVEQGSLTVKLAKVKKDSPLGGLKGSDSMFEIHTASYGDVPMVIQGAGAGAAVTARGVYTDILRISETLCG